jgi:predicted RNase H-like HicB family nuclease
MPRYVGLVHKATGTDYGVSFPDFPGVVTASASLGQARRLAVRALALHIAGMVEDGEAIPVPSSLDRILTRGDHGELTTIMVPMKSFP